MKNLQELAQCASGGPMQLQLAEEALRRGRKTWGFSCFFFEGNIYKVVNHGKPRNKPEYRLVDHSWVYHIKGI